MMKRVPKAASAAAIAAIGIAATFLLNAAPPAHAEPATSAKIAAGKAFAELACSSCHQVRSDQPLPAPVFDADANANVAAPSFLTIAAEPGVGAAYLRSLITLPHYPMREQMIADEDLNSVITYILSLGPAGPAKP